MSTKAGRGSPVGATRIQCVNGVWLMPLIPLVARINRRLNNQIPRRDIYFARLEYAYYVRVTGGVSHNLAHGPYDFKHLVALADYVNAFRLQERGMRPMSVISRSGIIRTQVRLPDHLRFDFMSPTLYAAMEALKQAGYSVVRARGGQALQAPSGELLGVEPLHGVIGVTAPVTPPQSPVPSQSSLCEHGLPLSQPCEDCDMFLSDVLGEIKDMEEEEAEAQAKQAKTQPAPASPTPTGPPSPPSFVMPPPPPVFGSSVAPEDDA